MLRSLRLSVFVLLAAACASSSIPDEAREREVAEASDRFSAARVRGDVAAFTASFTDDGMFMVPGLPDAAGRTEVQELAQKRFIGATVENFKVDDREIHVAGDSAYEIAWYSEINRHGDQAFEMRARHAIVWKRGSDNSWRVHRYLYNFSEAMPVK
jgi:uncharacterized protein (TIGR02246 family)